MALLTEQILSPTELKNSSLVPSESDFVEDLKDEFEIGNIEVHDLQV